MKRGMIITAALIAWAGTVLAQDLPNNPEVNTTVSDSVATAPAGELRVLDKLTGVVTDLILQSGQDTTLGFLRVRLNECRYPQANPSGDAYAEIVVHYRDAEQPIFAGWMIASSPALNAMDHPRYDVWTLRCMTS